MKGDGVEIPLDDHGGALFPYRRSGGVERVEGRTLVEEHGSLGVHVLAALLGAHRPAAKGDDPAPAVLDRDDQPFPEPVEQTAVAPADKAGRDGLLVGIALLPEIADETVPAVGGVAQPELVDRLGPDPAVGEI